MKEKKAEVWLTVILALEGTSAEGQRMFFKSEARPITKDYIT